MCVYIYLYITIQQHPINLLGNCGRGGGHFYIENIKELVDSDNEFFLEKGRTLYYMKNETQPYDEASQEVVATRLKTLIHLHGTSTHPIKGVSLKGITFQHTYETHMEDHEVPSGGDWSITRNAAILAEGVHDLVIEGNEFYHLG